MNAVLTGTARGQVTTLLRTAQGPRRGGIVTAVRLSRQVWPATADTQLTPAIIGRLRGVTEKDMIDTTIKHYEVESSIGKGGMGVMYRARDSRINRPVALKVLKSELVSDPDRRQRFVREARAAATITYPAIAQIYDVDDQSADRRESSDILGLWVFGY